jgi:putative ABC transport system permease protein
MSIGSWFAGIGEDLRYSWRTARRNPAFTLIAVSSLALGIGANTTIFTFVNAALLKPLPYPQADRIVAVMQRPLNGGPLTPVAPRSFVEWRERARSFEAIAIGQVVPTNTDGIDGAEQVAGLWTTSEMFRVFGVSPAMGRLFGDDEGQDRGQIRGEIAGTGTGVVLSHEYWARRFGSDPAVIGRAIGTRERSVVIGVLPPGFRVGSFAIDIYLPLRLDRSNPDAAGSRGFTCYGRLRPGVSIAAARAELSVLASQIELDNPLEKGWGVEVVSLRDSLVRDHRTVLLVLLGVVAFVLLIACANLAGLLLTRGVGRRSELALRASLGADRRRLIRQLITESVALSIAGGTLGLLIGVAASRGLVLLARDAAFFGQMQDLQTDTRVFVFTLLLSLLTAIAFGLIPAWQASKADLQAGLRLRSGSTGDTRGQQRFHAALVVGEVALAVVLLVGASLLLRTFSHLLDVKLGFETERVLTMRMIVMNDAPRRASFVERMLDRVGQIPGVQAAGTIQFLPLSGFTNHGPFRFLGREQALSPSRMESDLSTVSRGYFAAMGIPILQGRAFERWDQMDSPRVALVNEAFVSRYCGNENPIGMRIIGDWADPKPTEIIGVTGNIRHKGLTVEPSPTVFLAQAQVPGYITFLVVRSTADPIRLVPAIRSEIRHVDPHQATTAIQLLDQYVSAALARPKLYAVLLAAFAALALLLASIGLYGLIAYAVTRRTREIGLRMALGARPGDILWSTLGRTATLVLTGLSIGVAGALLLSRYIATLLYGVSPTDASSYLLVAALLVGIALVATYAPARRASKVDPMTALRTE